MGFPTKQVEKRFVQCAVRREEGRHSYEWKLDVAGLDMGQIEPNKVWSLAVVVVDADGDQRDSVSFISWGKASEGYGYSLVGDILLVPKTEPFGTIEGQVAWTDDEGEAPPRQVRIVSEADSSFHIRTVTDRNGCFMAALPAGSYAVAVEDFRMAHGLPISARVQAGQTVSLGVHEAARIIPSTYHREPADLQSVHRGVCWEAGGNDLTEYHMVPLVQSGVEWISQTTFGWQSKHNSPEIRPNRSGGGESDRGIADVSRLAKRFGIRTMLKPHIWLGRGAWRGDIAMDSEEDWQEWFSQYRSFILRYARLADREGIEVLCIGTELRRAAVEREADWRKLIAEIRAVYNGKLIYAANWYKEFEEVAFWDELDYIGIQAYFPLVEKERFDVSKWTGGERISSVEDLSRGWDKHVEAIARIHEKFRKPVIITEIGYHSTIDAAVQPWEWKISDLDATFEEGLRTQTNCYEAFLKVFWGREFFAGVYFWKWHPYHHDAGGSQDRDYTPQNKPAELVMRRWYQRFVD